MKGWHFGVNIAIAIGMHNVPEGIAVAVSMYSATGDKWSAMKWSLISGLCEPVGAAAFGYFFYSFVSSEVVNYSLSGVAGIMTYICVKELIPNALHNVGTMVCWGLLLSNSNVQYTIVANILGMMLLYVCSYFLAQYGMIQQKLIIINIQNDVKNCEQIIILMILNWSFNNSLLQQQSRVTYIL